MPITTTVVAPVSVFSGESVSPASSVAFLAPPAVRGPAAGTGIHWVALPIATPHATDPRALLRSSIDSLLDDPRFHNAFWGVLIVDPAKGDTLFARNADKLFIPASNMKLVTGSVALVRLGPDFRFRTVFAVRGRLNQGVLDGDLLVIGRGDPTVSDHMMHDAMIPLRAAADSAIAHGIRSVTGRLVSGGDAFPGNNVSAGWEWDDLTEAYGAGVDELMFNEGFTNIILHAGKRPGAAAKVSTTPLADYPPVRAHVTTAAPVAGSTTADLTVAFDAAHSTVDIEGALVPRDSTMLLVAYPDQTSAYLFAFADALRTAGITLRTQPVAAPVGNPSASSPGDAGAVIPVALGQPMDTLFTLTSPPLRDVLAAMLKPSQNQIAEVLLKTLGLEFTGVGLADSGRRVIESQLSAWGVPSDGYVIHDGSGLSRHDYVSPATLVRILTVMAGDSTFPTFYDALPIAGVDGTLETRMRATSAAGNVRAKTGSVDRARSLSGYVTTADGTRLIFSMLCNNWTTPVHDVEQVQDLISARLASLNLAAK